MYAAQLASKGYRQMSRLSNSMFVVLLLTLSACGTNDSVKEVVGLWKSSDGVVKWQLHEDGSLEWQSSNPETIDKTQTGTWTKSGDTIAIELGQGEWAAAARGVLNGDRIKGELWHPSDPKDRKYEWVIVKQ